ncbi:hypothetical protein H4R99_008679, partial [Coemansia sp. RSA 1722]
MSSEDSRRSPFDGKNQPYRLWSIKMKGLLRSKSCLEAIQVDFAQVLKEADPVTLEAAQKADGIAVMLILDSLDDALAEKVCDLSAFQMWQTIERMFNSETTCSLITKLRELLLHSMDSDHDDPIEYWIASMAKWHQFPRLELNLREAAPLIVLGGLSPSYAMVRDKFASVPPGELEENKVLDAIKDLYSMQIQSAKRNGTSGSISGAILAVVVCQLCDKHGHLAKNCSLLNSHSVHSGEAPTSKVDR